MGGIASAAIQHPGTEIRVDEHLIVTSPDFLTSKASRQALQPVRENGTLRDMDALVLSTDPDEIAAIETAAGTTIGDRLEISVFGLHKAAQLREQVANPFGWQALKTFVSDRYVDVDYDGAVFKALFPFAVEVPTEALETYSLEVGREVFPVANPAAAILNYWTRSISGLRPKDADKIQAVAANVFAKAPELVEWMVDGPGQSQMELAAILHTLRRANSQPRSSRELTVGGAVRVQAGSVRDLADNPAFLLPNADPNTRDGVLALAILKSRGLGIPESNETIVRLYQRFAEQRLATITKNQAGSDS